MLFRFFATSIVGVCQVTSRNNFEGQETHNLGLRHDLSAGHANEQILWEHRESHH